MFKLIFSYLCCITITICASALAFGDDRPQSRGGVCPESIPCPKKKAKPSNKYNCTAHDKASCNQGDEQSVTINNQDKYYLTDRDINYICNANGHKSICSKGDGQSLYIYGNDMDGKKVMHDSNGYYILPSN